MLATATALGCQREQPRTEKTPVETAVAPPPNKARCDDVSGLTPDEINRRKELKVRRPQFQPAADMRRLQSRAARARQQRPVQALQRAAGAGAHRRLV